MIRSMIRRTSLLLLFCAVLPALCCAQSGPEATPPAASQPSAQAANGQTTPAASKTDKTKKVWTNDEVKTLQGTVSVVGTNRPGERQTQSSLSGDAPGDPRRGKILQYRVAIGELRKKIDAADQRISQLRNFKAEDSSPSGGINPNRGYNMIPLDEQVKQLEAKKKQWLGNIDDLENQAKKEGIEPGELR